MLALMLTAMHLSPSSGGHGLGLCNSDGGTKDNSFVCQVHSDVVKGIIGLSLLKCQFVLNHIVSAKFSAPFWAKDGWHGQNHLVWLE
jgi:hypothetical protein